MQCAAVPPACAVAVGRSSTLIRVGGDDCSRHSRDRVNVCSTIAHSHKAFVGGFAICIQLAPQTVILHS
jgi:hypothetical protein